MRAAIARHLARKQRVDELVLREPLAKPYVRRCARHADEVRPAFLRRLYHRQIQTQQVEHVLHFLHPDIREDSVFQLVQRRSEEHTSELQSRGHLVCRLLLEKKKYYIGSSAYLPEWR